MFYIEAGRHCEVAEFPKPLFAREGTASQSLAIDLMTSTFISNWDFATEPAGCIESVDSTNRSRSATEARTELG